MFQKDEYCVVILGLDNAGKTTLLEHIKRKFVSTYKGLPFEKISATVGMNVGRIDISSVRLIFWDLGGQQELQSLWDKYFVDCHGVIYVIDSSDQARLEESYQSFETAITNPNLNTVPLLVLANKQDKDNALKVEEVKTVFNRSSQKIGKRDCFVEGVSALSGEGIEKGIQWMVQCVKRNIHRPPREKVIS